MSVCVALRRALAIKCIMPESEGISLGMMDATKSWEELPCIALSDLVVSSSICL